MSDDAPPAPAASTANDAPEEVERQPKARPAPTSAAPAATASTSAAPPDPGTPTSATPAAVPAQDAKGQQKVRFDSANIKSTYCNVCNATSTREEVVINFGVNKTWDQGGQELEVQLEHRIILSPFAAKRLQDLLVRLITEHEQRYGKLN
jgi:Protein of unknown function (DUF3467)